MVVEYIANIGREIIERGREGIEIARNSGHLKTAIISAGFTSFVLLGIDSCSENPRKIPLNVEEASQAKLLQPDRFDFLNDGKLHITNYVSDKTITLDSKISSNGVRYFQGTRGGDALVPAKIDGQGNLTYR